jgi:hypothetical protein
MYVIESNDQIIVTTQDFLTWLIILHRHEIPYV